MRQSVLVVLGIGLAAVLLGVVGCRPAASPEELGTVVYEVPKIPGSDAPYPMPQVDSVADATPPAPGSGAPPAGHTIEVTPPPR